MSIEDYRGCGICEADGGFLISTSTREGKLNREFKICAASIEDVHAVIDAELAMGPDFIHMSEEKKLKALGLWA